MTSQKTPHTEKQPLNSYQLIMPLYSVVLVMLWLVSTTNAQATPQITICHKPGTGDQTILTISQTAFKAHKKHGDYEVKEEVCDGKDNDCDSEVDENPTDLGMCTPGVGECAVQTQQVCVAGKKECPAPMPPEATEVSCNDGKDNDCDGLIDNADPDCTPCPTECTDAIILLTNHDFTGHTLVIRTCSFDTSRQAGEADLGAFTTVELHDILIAAYGTCQAVSRDGSVNFFREITNAEQRACAPIAAQAIRDITGEQCNISQSP